MRTALRGRRRQGGHGCGPGGRARMVRPVLAGVLVALVALPAAVAPATAEPRTAGIPGAADDRSARSAARGGVPDPVDGPVPVAVTLLTLEPREVRPDSALAVTVSLRNTGSVPTGPLRVRLQRGSVIATRSELALTDSGIPAVSTRFCPFAAEPGLAPGGRAIVRYSCTAAQLGLFPASGLGVYPLALTVQGDPAGTGAAGIVGQVSTLLPFFPPSVRPKAARVAWLWPLLDRPHVQTVDAGAEPVFDDDQLARSVAHGGRLDRLLGIAERAPAGVRLTLLVDPETVQEIHLMAQGYRVRVSGGRTVPGSGARAAKSWLDRLARAARRHAVVAVPFADPDLAALDRANLSALGQANPSDIDELRTRLDAPVSGQLAWPPAGLVTDDVLDDLVSHGVRTVVLDSAALPRTNDAAGPTPSGVSPLPALSGQPTALVSDPGLQRLLNLPAAGGARLAEQRVLAELAMIVAEEPGVARTLVLTPPRRWDTAGGPAGQLVADLARLPWLSSVDAERAAATTPPVRRGSLVYPAGASRAELTTTQTRTVDAAQAMVVDFRSALDDADAGRLLAPYRDALRRATSSGWRGMPAAGEAYARQLSARITALRGRVSVVEPQTGVYSLASADSPLSVTVQNGLDAPVKVKVSIAAVGRVGFAASDVGVQVVRPQQRTTLRVPAHVERSGTFSVEVLLSTPGHGRLGEPVELRVRSTAYGPLALGISAVALAVLILAVAVRLVRRLRAAAPPPSRPGTPADRSVR